MSLFQPPPPTAYDLVFNIFGIEVRVHPFFWLIAILFGASAGSPAAIAAWVVAMFVSILVHELGHSMAMRYFGQDSRIVLHSFGGLAIPIDSVGYGNGPRTPWHYIVISIAGPFAGLLLASIIAVGVEQAGGFIVYRKLLNFFPYPIAHLPFEYTNGNIIVNYFLFINIFWGLINMMPVFPLDGGQMTRELFILFGRRNQIVNSLWLSVITGGIIAILAVIFLQSFYMGFLFGYLAYQSYQAIQFV